LTGPRLIAIELEGFRGFAKRQRLDLDANAVLVRGDNGSGKTSLVDGLLWLFCGELEYLAERVRKLRRNEDIVQSRFTDVPARVALELEHEGHRYVFERSGDERAPSLRARRDGATIGGAELALANLFGHPTSSSLHTAVLIWGVLRQDAVRAALDAAGGALYQRLAGIVGLEQVSGFATAASAASRGLLTQRTAARKATEALRHRQGDAVQRHRSAEQDLAARAGAAESVHTALAAAAQPLREGLVLQMPDAVQLPALAALGADIGTVVDALNELAARRQARVDVAMAQDDGVEEAERNVKLARQQLAAVSEEGPATTRLAQAALEVLDGDVCPVCGQHVEEADLRAHLQEVVGHADQLFSSAQQASDALARAGSRLSEARERQRLRRQREEDERRAAAAVTAAFDAISGLRMDAPIPDDAGEVASLAAELGTFLDEIRSLYRSASEASGAHLERLAGEANALGVELASAQRELQDLEMRYDRAKVLERAAHEAAEKIVARALDDLQPSFAEVFDRLNPNPAFTELRARQDVLRNVNQVVPIVRDPQRGIDANPLLVFSEGQLNVVALSYFLGMALNARDAMLPFLVLDDPLQALDTIAVLGFGDLCRRIRDHRQLLVTTHDRRFADILARKLAPREPGDTTIVHEFEGWTREGPSVRTSAPDIAEVIPLLRRRAS
jgi:DNA repair exonuclease SbcCD ATPase subunit